MQDGTAGDKHVQPGTRLQQVSKQGGGRHHLPEVVEHHQARLVLQGRLQELQVRPVTHCSQGQGLSNGGQDEGRSADGSQWNETDAVGKAIEQGSSALQREPGFAHPGGAGQRHQAHLWPSQERRDDLYVLLAPNERCGLGRQVVGGGGACGCGERG